jgi:hypothetical protein
MPRLARRGESLERDAALRRAPRDVHRHAQVSPIAGAKTRMRRYLLA